MPPPRPSQAASPALDAAFTALADARRRAVIRVLLGRPRRAGELAREVGLSPPALSRHLRILRHAGLVDDDADAADARVRLYRVRDAGLTPVRDWIADIEAYWTAQLDAFKVHAERRATPARKRR